MKVDQLKVFLVIDGENYGKVTSLDYEEDTQEVYSDMGGQPMILKTWSTPTRYTIRMPGAEIEAKRFMQTAADEPKTFKLLLNSTDIIRATMYPYEDQQLWARMVELFDAAKIPFSVYNESVSLDCEIITSADGHAVQVYTSPSVETDEQYKMLKLIPALEDEIKCPECDHLEILWSTIIHLNDEHEWTRERIADWLETLDADITFPIGEEENGNDS